MFHTINKYKAVCRSSPRAMNVCMLIGVLVRVHLLYACWVLMEQVGSFSTDHTVAALTPLENKHWFVYAPSFLTPKMANYCVAFVSLCYVIGMLRAFSSKVTSNNVAIMLFPVMVNLYWFWNSDILGVPNGLILYVFAVFSIFEGWLLSLRLEPFWFDEEYNTPLDERQIQQWTTSLMQAKELSLYSPLFCSAVYWSLDKMYPIQFASMIAITFYMRTRMPLYIAFWNRSDASMHRTLLEECH